MGEPVGEVVFQGVRADITWQVRAHGDQVDLHSMLHLYRGSKTLAASGMGGPPLPPGELIHAMRSYSPLTPGEPVDSRSGDGDRAPAHVLVRAHPDVIAVVVTTERNQRVPMALSGVVQPWDLSFGVAVLKQGDTTGGLSVYTAAGEVGAPALPHDGHWWALTVDRAPARDPARRRRPAAQVAVLGGRPTTRRPIARDNAENPASWSRQAGGGLGGAGTP